MSIALRLAVWLAISVITSPFIALLCSANTRLKSLASRTKK